MLSGRLKLKLQKKGGRDILWRPGIQSIGISLKEEEKQLIPVRRR